MKQDNNIAAKGGFKNSFGLNLLAIIALCVALYFLFFTMLGKITGHGDEVKVPNMIGKTIKDGAAQLDKIGFDVDIDSSYDPDQKPYTILGQQPGVGEIVKPGRTIFLTINKAEPPKTPMPNLTGLSFRSAVMILKSSKLALGDTSFKPDIAQGAILDQLFNGKTIRAGQLIPQGSRISLVIGDGLGNTEFDVPDIVGMTYAEAVAMLAATNLHFTAIASDNITDTANAIVYRQVPSSFNELGNSNRLREGDELGFYYKQNPSPEELQHGPELATPVDSNAKK